jgi:hypothetical protein
MSACEMLTKFALVLEVHSTNLTTLSARIFAHVNFLDVQIHSPLLTESLAWWTVRTFVKPFSSVNAMMNGKLRFTAESENINFC